MIRASGTRVLPGSDPQEGCRSKVVWQQTQPWQTLQSPASGDLVTGNTSLCWCHSLLLRGGGSREVMSSPFPSPASLALCCALAHLLVTEALGRLALTGQKAAVVTGVPARLHLMLLRSV